ncbi:MAG: hypothetical protein IJU90_09595 [Bacteroidales bacterium]|nr:hypothetical protein [Bacteroidales bacterium]
MKNKIIAFLTLIVTLTATQAQMQRVSVLDIAGDYGLPSIYIKDTNVFISTIATQTSDYVARAAQCANISTRTQTMLLALRNDFLHRDGLIWLDGKRAIYDFAEYEPRLQQLSIVAGRYSQYYLQMEQARQKHSANESLGVGEDDLQRIQQSLNDRANLLKDSAEYLHDSISSICIYNISNDRVLAKERKDIYYAYMPIYNRISTLPAKSTEQTLRDLQDLLWMQNNMLANVVSDDSYSIQITQFPVLLKSYAEPEATDIYRSYMRHFTHTSALIVFNSVAGYRRYVEQMKNIADVQRKYMQAIDLRRDINKRTDTITELYSRGYTAIFEAYRRHLASINTMPTFNRSEESKTFIAALEEFSAIQKLYISNYYRLRQIEQRGDSIVQNCPKSCSDLRSIYLGYPKVQSLVPSFRTLEQYGDYERMLSDFELLQKDFQTIVSMRDSIERTDQRLTTSQYAERVFVSGYKAIKKGTSLNYPLANDADAAECIRQLRIFMDQQALCDRILQKKQAVDEADALIASYEKTLPNVCIAYGILRKDYVYRGTITSLEDMQNYHIHLIELADIQARFISIIKSEQAADINIKMRGLRDLQQIKSLFHL